MVAALLKYAHEWRGLFLSSPREFSRISALEAEIQEIKEDKAKLFLKDSILSDKDKNLLATLAQAQISEREGEKELLESKVNIGLEPLAAKIDEQFKKEGTTQSVPNFKKILGLIAKAIEDEIRNSASPYPRYTIEQIILAFFCHKFNTKDDIQKLLSCLPNFVRDRLTLDSSVWKIKNIDSASNNPSDLDFIYAIQFMIGKIIKWISVNLLLIVQKSRSAILPTSCFIIQLSKSSMCSISPRLHLLIMVETSVNFTNNKLLTRQMTDHLNS